MRIFTQNQDEFKTKASRFQIPITAQPQHRSTITVFISSFRTYALPLDLRHDSMLTKIWTISHGKITDFGSRFTRRPSGGPGRRPLGGFTRHYFYPWHQLVSPIRFANGGT
jgi:hypothetical protein